MALLNCTIDQKQVSVTKDTALTSSVANQVLTITPNSGYVVKATDFANNTTSSFTSPVQSIALTDSSTPYAANNTVLVTVDLKDTFVPTADADVVIDIDGQAILAKEIPYVASGAYKSTIANCNESSQDITFSTSSIAGVNYVIFTQPLTASTNFYLEESGITATADNGVTIDFVDHVYNSEDRLTFVRVNYMLLQPSNDVTNIDLNLSATAVADNDNTAVPKLITGISCTGGAYSDTVSASGELKDLTVFGTAGSNAIVTLTTSAGSDTYDFTTNAFTSASTTKSVVIPASGSITIEDIIFPAGTGSATVTFTFSVAGGSSPSTLTTENSSSDNTPFTKQLTQGKAVTVTTTATETHPDVNSLTYENNVLYGSAGQSYYNEEGDLYQTQSIKITAATSGQLNDFVLRRQPAFPQDFTNTDFSVSGSGEWQMTGLEAVSVPSGSGSNAKVVITGKAYGLGLGPDNNVSSVINLDNIINIKPTVTNQSVSVPHNTATTHTITGASDGNGDALTFSIASAPSNGTMTMSSGGVLQYTPNTNYSGSDTATYKVNDGFEDSIARLITFTVAGSGSPGGGGSFSMTFGTTVFHDITGGGSSVISPNGLIEFQQGRTNSESDSNYATIAAGDQKIRYTFDFELDANDLPAYVDQIGDITFSARPDNTNSSMKFRDNNNSGVTYESTIATGTVTNNGYGSNPDPNRKFEGTVHTVVSNFGTTANGDELTLIQEVSFTNINQ
tara:strand:+ start:5566 stop:7767 length:2202 start_codon:yes stop_codon:yes gene_type:complete